jgi:hypothetical protein
MCRRDLVFRSGFLTEFGRRDSGLSRVAAPDAAAGMTSARIGAAIGAGRPRARRHIEQKLSPHMEAMEPKREDPPASQPATSQQFAPGQAEHRIVGADLSKEIELAVERQPGDRVRVTWIHGPNYRCNWWSPSGTARYDNPGMYGLVLTTHRVRMSRFLSVRKVGDGLVIEDRTHAR